MARSVLPSFILNDPTLKAYWRFDGADTDASGKGKNLSVTGSPVFEAGRFGMARRCSSSDYLSIGDNLGIDGGNVSIIGYWKVNSAPSSGNEYTFIQQASSSAKVSYYIRYGNNAGTLRIRIGRSNHGVGGVDIYYNTDIGTFQYACIALTYDGTTVTAYLNGVPIGTGTNSGNGSDSGVPSRTALNIDSYDLVNRPGNASHDQVLVLGRTLSQQEIIMFTRLMKTPVTARMLRWLARGTFTSTLTESITTTDTFTRTTIRALSETITNTDAFTFLKVRAASFTESITNLDTLIRTVAHSFVETITNTDAIVRTLARLYTEGITTLDTIKRTTARIFTDTITTMDTIVRTTSRLLIESITTTDRLARTMSRFYAESVSIADTFFRGSSKVFTETFSMLDTIVKRLNGLKTLYTSKFTPRGTSHDSKFTDRGTSHTTKFQ